MKKTALVIFVLGLLAWKPVSTGDEFCGLRNFAFQDGEKITYQVFYSVIGLYINAGSASFTINPDHINNRAVYHVIGAGSSNPSYDWIFKVRDRYESYIDTATLQPLKFIRDIDEGGFKKQENITFNHKTNSAITTTGTFKVPSCIQDVLSAIYYARNIDFGRYRIDDKIPFSMFLDNEVYNLYIKYQGKELIKTKYGKFNAIKFKPLLVKG
ncbi:MAG: hypothetical protein RLZZ28_190, partial [Bacteroidota bacterium]